MDKTLTVEIWFDLICPWSWIGKRRFERALADFPHREQVRVEHRSFRLMPGLAPQPVKNMLARRFGAAVQATDMLQQVEQSAAAEGLTYRLAGTLVGDTLDAHRLVKFAAIQGLQSQAVEHMYRSYFSEHASLFDHDTLVRLATEVGLERNAVVALLDGQSYATDVEQDQRRVQSFCANGVPFFLINGRVTVGGAQPATEFLIALNQAWAVHSPSLRTEPQGTVCGLDGCAMPTH